MLILALLACVEEPLPEPVLDPGPGFHVPVEAHPTCPERAICDWSRISSPPPYSTWDCWLYKEHYGQASIGGPVCFPPPQQQSGEKRMGQLIEQTIKLED